MELQEVKAYFETNKANTEVQAYINSFRVQPTLEVFKGLINTDTGLKSFMDSEKDIHTSKSLDTWKANNLDKIYQERFTKENPGTTPAELKYQELENKFNAAEKGRLKETLTNKAFKLLNDKKLTGFSELIDKLIGEDENTTNLNINSLSTMLTAHDEALKAEILKGSSYTPPNNNGGSGGANPWKIGSINLTEQGRIYTENPELAKTMMINNK